MRTRMVTALALALALAVPAAARTQGDARKAAWLSVAHPGLGEYYNAGWGSFFDRCLRPGRGPHAGRRRDLRPRAGCGLRLRGRDARRLGRLPRRALPRPRRR